MITTRGRYALRVLIDLAQQDQNKYTPMKEISARQGISLKYLEQIMPVLIKGKIVDGVSGKGGGYRLSRTPEEYTIYEILTLTEGSLAPVACLHCNADKCKRSDKCRTLPMWQKYNELTTDFFANISLAELTK